MILCSQIICNIGLVKILFIQHQGTCDFLPYTNLPPFSEHKGQILNFHNSDAML